MKIFVSRIIIRKPKLDPRGRGLLFFMFIRPHPSLHLFGK
jgi:hypothetical protein